MDEKIYLYGTIMIKVRISFLFLLLLCGSQILSGQFNPASSLTVEEKQEATVARFPTPIELDGRLEEPYWQLSRPATNFWETFPSDTLRCAYQTEIYFGFDDAHLYVGAKCYTPGKQFVISSLRRDFRAGGNDNLTFVFNTFRDKNTAIVFGMNPLGVNREALIYNGGENSDDFREEWDNKWQGESYIGDGYWSCELKIPFSSMRFPQGDTEWFFNSYRFDTQSNTRSTWNRIPQNQLIMSLAYMGNLYFPEPPLQKGSGITLIPYLGGSYTQDFEADGAATWTSNLGGDAKVAIGSNLNLDLTVNPDFSQVEVDQQVINTSRFEIFFPERRQFFLENADLFGSFGFSYANPFFSRRIGVTVDTSTGAAVQNPIYAGARLSGRLNADWRIGLLNMQAAANKNNGLPSYNYTVAAVQRRVGARSNIGLIAVNKENFTQFSDSSRTNADFNRVIGIDYNLATTNNKWNGKTFYHQSLSQLQQNDSWSHGFSIEYRHRHWNLAYEHAYVGDHFNAEVGFIPRRGVFSTNVQARQISYPSTPKIVQKGPQIGTNSFLTPGEGITDYLLSGGYGWQYGNTSSLNMAINHNYTFLLEAFDPSRSDARPLPGQQDYAYSNLEIRYQSDSRKKFNTNLLVEAGQFFNGHRYGLSGSLVYRYQPYGAIDLRVNYQYIQLPAPYAQTALFLIGPRIDLTLTKSVFFTTFIQYNDQINNLNINTRLQWRFAPVSDLFFVYTDNYDSLRFGAKSRAIFAKVTYWLNT